jgi:hypothetical protein
MGHPRGHIHRVSRRKLKRHPLELYVLCRGSRAHNPVLIGHDNKHIRRTIQRYPALHHNELFFGANRDSWSLYFICFVNLRYGLTRTNTRTRYFELNSSLFVHKSSSPFPLLRLLPLTLYHRSMNQLISLVARLNTHAGPMGEALVSCAYREG